ncbi:DUF6037 family protein [Brevibacillus sp. NRS-1366]|uniref:DUF6037 family protein n=1 Tax=Brevibacillus sp. NRS-1366 TaxID=3233899 RepID=UPI003D1AD75E
MILNNLKPLFKSMQDNKIKRVRFPFSMANAVFDVFFFVDERPFTLMFGAKGLNFYFEVPVKNGFDIDPILDNNVYNTLCKILGLKYDPNQKFSPRIFFQEFDKKIPHNVSAQNVPKPHHVATYRKNVEENDKIFFMKWLDNTIQSHDVRPENLEKTKRILGYEAYIRCKQKNISSCWTDNESKAVDFYLP